MSNDMAKKLSSASPGQTVPPASGSAARVWFWGRFLDGELTLLLSELADPGPGYAVNPITNRIWRNGEYVGDALKLSYDREALGWWVEYQSWRGSPLDHPTVTTPLDDPIVQACIDNGGHFWDDTPEGQPPTCTRCWFNPGWKAGKPRNEHNVRPIRDEPQA